MSKDDLFDYDDLDAEAFERMVEDGFVHVSPPPGENFLMDDQFERRAHELNRKPYAGSQKVTIVPDRKGPWSGNNQLGIEQPFAPDANNLQTILKLDEWGFPEDWTICLGMEYDDNQWEDDPRLFDVTALIAFGVGGTTQEVEIDWLAGSAITVPMNAVNVRAKYSFPSFGEGGENGHPPPDLRLQVTLGQKPSINARPTRSYYFPADTPFPVTLKIPPFAKAVIISAIEDPFAFYTQVGFVDFISDPIAAASARTSGTPIICSYTLTQLVSYLDFINGVCGAPMSLPIPSFARGIQLNPAGLVDLGIRDCHVQFLIGL